MVLSYVFLKTRYKLINIMGVLLTVIGIACLVFADFNSPRNNGGHSEREREREREFILPQFFLKDGERYLKLLTSLSPPQVRPCSWGTCCVWWEQCCMRLAT